MRCVAIRRATGALAIARVMSSALFGVDPHFTKTTLEHIERELGRHVRYLASRTAPATPSRPQPVEAEPVPGPSGLAASLTSPRPVFGVEEESSGVSGQYVTAVSVSSLEFEEQQPSASTPLFQPADVAAEDDHYLESAI